MTMRSPAELLLRLGVFWILLISSHCTTKVNLCICDWGNVQVASEDGRCHSLNETNDPRFFNSSQQYCSLAHGQHDGFCLIDILIEVNNMEWSIHPHCEQAASDGLILHCSEDSPFSAYNNHNGPIHTFQYCCSSHDFCNNRTISDIQREMCTPQNVEKIKQKMVMAQSSDYYIDKICVPPPETSPHLSLILTIVIICAVFLAVSFFALFSWNRIVKYKLEYDRSCRRHENDVDNNRNGTVNNRSISATPVGETHRNGWLVALSSAFTLSRRGRLRGRHQSAQSAPLTTVSTIAPSLRQPSSGEMGNAGENQTLFGDSLSYDGQHTISNNASSYNKQVTRPISGRRFPKIFRMGNGHRLPSAPSSSNGGLNMGRHSPLTFDTSSTVQTGDSLLPTTTTSAGTSCNRSQQLNGHFGEFSTSGSGSGRPLLGARTVARQIQLGTIVGKGRYGEVYSGSWVGGRVAVKVFPSREQQSWAREIEIYNALTMRHKNVLTFVAADSKDIGFATQLWLVTSFHHRGSLFDFLTMETVPLRIALRLAMGICSGVAHLHMEIPGNQGKPAIAHRDLKSKNILVTSHLSACIADFGLAVKYTSSTQSLDIPVNLRVGTRRYMAPELLDGSFHASSFDSYISADLYAVGLVLWEILTRCHLHREAPADEYALPYSNLVPPDPSDQDMLDAVCANQARPVVPERFTDPQPDCCPTHRRILTTLGRLVVELWDKEPTVRNSALHVKKTLLLIHSQMRDLHKNQESSPCFYTNLIDPPRHGSDQGSSLTKHSSVASSSVPLVRATSSMEVSSSASSSEEDDD